MCRHFTLEEFSIWEGEEEFPTLEGTEYFNNT